MLSSKSILIIISLLILVTNPPAPADWKEHTGAIDISGGENHTLVLTSNKWAWACGDNYYGELGNGEKGSDKPTLIRVHGLDNIGYLEDINDLDAGWTHSLALDANTFVWAWGDNGEGQLGDGSPYDRLTPVKVHGVSGVGFLESITAISAGRSGMQSLAVDANNLVYAWGYNEYGQCGNGESGTNERELTPVRVLSGEQDPNDPDTVLQYIVAVSAGADQSMALDANGLVYTWGTDSGRDDDEPGYGFADGPDSRFCRGSLSSRNRGTAETTANPDYAT
jgi:alpha-tubulin suppressor-like RCC1 family protein